MDAKRVDIERIAADLDLSKLKCFYADVRLEQEAGTEVGFKNGELEQFSPAESLGVFLRVYNNGKWFYKATTDLSSLMQELQGLVTQSLAFTGECKDIFQTVPTTHENFVRFTANDPRRIPLADKRAVCESYLGVTEGVSQVKEFKVWYKDRYQKRAFKSSRGRSFVYDYVDFGVALIFIMRDGEHFFRDRYLTWGNTIDDVRGKTADARATLNEALRHLTAPAIEPGRYTVAMNSEVVGVFTHESFGHKSEADFMLGDPAAREEWKIGSKVANENVSIVDSGVFSNGSGYCPVDDEGMPTKKTYLIKDGILQGRLHSLATASEFDEAPTGNARALNFEYEPIVRMTGTYIEAGKSTEEELIAGIKNGIYVNGCNHGSGLSTFTIAPSRSYRIRDGKIAEPVKVAVLSGTVFETLNKISGVSNSVKIHNSVFGGFFND